MFALEKPHHLAARFASSLRGQTRAYDPDRLDPSERERNLKITGRLASAAEIAGVCELAKRTSLA
jgi:hypothetical protein